MFNNTKDESGEKIHFKTFKVSENEVKMTLNYMKTKDI